MKQRKDLLKDLIKILNDKRKRNNSQKLSDNPKTLWNLVKSLKLVEKGFDKY